MPIDNISPKGQLASPAKTKRQPGKGAGSKIESLEEADGLKLRVVRPAPEANFHQLAGMVKAPPRGRPRSLEDFHPASLLRRARSREP